MTSPRAIDPHLPQGFVTAMLLAASAAGPIGLWLFTMWGTAAAWAAAVCPLCPTANDVMPQAPSWDGLWQATLVPLVLAPFAAVASLVVASLPALFAGTVLLAAADGRHWITRASPWATAGAAVGAAIGMLLATFEMQPSAPLVAADLELGALLGALDGAASAWLAWRALRRQGVFTPGGK